MNDTLIIGVSIAISGLLISLGLQFGLYAIADAVKSRKP